MQERVVCLRTVLSDLELALVTLSFFLSFFLSFLPRSLDAGSSLPTPLDLIIGKTSLLPDFLFTNP